MRSIRCWLARLRALFTSQRQDREFAEELKAHVELHIAEKLRTGMTLEAARRDALLKLGGIEAIKEEQRERRGLSWLDTLAQDVRYSIRTLRQNPGFTAVAIVTLAIGIGANTAIFSLINSLLLRQLPVRQPERLVSLSDNPVPSNEWTYAIWNQIRQQPDLFDDAFVYSFQRFNLASGGEVDSVRGMWASGGFFTTLGVAPVLGRIFTDADDQRGGGPTGPVAVISYAFWQQRFGGSVDAIGRTLTVERVPFTIIGITPPGFFGPDVGRSFDVIVPLETEPLIQEDRTAFDRPTTYWLTLMARLRLEDSLDAAVARLRAVQPEIRQSTLPPPNMSRGDTYLTTPFMLLPAGHGNSSLRQDYERPLLTMMGAVAVLLLIACASIGNLMLARAIARTREISIRTALGASRWRVLRQLLTESLVLSLLGAAVGMFLAAWGSRFLVKQLSTQTNVVFLELSPDWRVLAFTVSLAVVTAVFFGSLPAFRASQVELHETLKEHGQRAPRTRGGFSSGLVVVQVALSLLLVMAAGLFGRTFAHLVTLDLGFERDGLMVVNVNASRARIPPAERFALFDRVRHAIRLVPGVEDTAMSYLTPIGGTSGRMGPIDVPGGKELAEVERLPFVNWISPRWFSTYGVALVAGRDFIDRDDRASQPVVVVNEAFARKFLGVASPIGRSVRWGGQGFPGGLVTAEIVGLVTDAAYRSAREASFETMYMPLAQLDRVAPQNAFATSIALTVRSAKRERSSPVPAVTTAVAAVDRNLSLTFRPLAEQVNASFTQERLLAMLSGFFGVLALLLAVLGLYGVTSYAVRCRRTELGIRIALGALPGRVTWMVLRRIAVLLAIGVGAGTLLSWWSAKFVAATLLYGVQPRDITTLASAALVLIVVGLVAGWLPAHRAGRIDPAQVLREA